MHLFYIIIYIFFSKLLLTMTSIFVLFIIVTICELKRTKSLCNICNCAGIKERIPQTSGAFNLNGKIVNNSFPVLTYQKLNVRFYWFAPLSTLPLRFFFFKLLFGYMLL